MGVHEMTPKQRREVEMALSGLWCNVETVKVIVELVIGRRPTDAEVRDLMGYKEAK